jgi:Ca-activated chloride channel family protein
VVSDGEQLQGDAFEAAQKALREGIRVHTAGVGSERGARVPVRAAQAPGFVHNALGREVISRRDEQRLQRIALAGGGLYSRIDEANSLALVDWFRRAAATLPRSTEKRVVNEPRERFQWPMALALVILATESMLGDRRRRSSHVPERTL